MKKFDSSYNNFFSVWNTGENLVWKRDPKIDLHPDITSPWCRVGKENPSHGSQELKTETITYSVSNKKTSEICLWSKSHTKQIHEPKNHKELKFSHLNLSLKQFEGGDEIHGSKEQAKRHGIHGSTLSPLHAFNWSLHFNVKIWTYDWGCLSFFTTYVFKIKKIWSSSNKKYFKRISTWYGYYCETEPREWSRRLPAAGGAAGGAAVGNQHQHRG